MKKQFDISMRPQIESGEYKVITRDGHPVRILCYDRKGKFNIIALVDDGYIEIKQEYTPDGCLLHDKSEHRLDLFVITPEPEMTEFEKGIYDMMVCRTNEATISEEYARQYSSKLLELARKELQPKYDDAKVDDELIERMTESKVCLTPDVTWFYREGLRDMYKQFAEELDVAFKHQDEVVYNRGYDKGQKEVLKDLPKWEQTESSFYPEAKITLTNRLCYNEYSISIDELLEKLPKRNRTIDGKLVDE